MNRLCLSLLCVASVAFSAEVTKTEHPKSDDRTPSLLIAPKIGFFKTTTPLAGAFYAGLELGYVLPALDHKLALVLEGNWHQPAVSGAVSDPQLTPPGGTAADGSYRLVEREMAVLLSAVYRFTGLFTAFVPYVGAGPGFYYHVDRITAFGSSTVESEGTFGFQAVAGGELHLGPGALFVELHYHFTNIDFLSTGKVNVGGFLAAGLGYRFEL